MGKKNDGFDDFLLFQTITGKGGGCLTLILSVIGGVALLISALI